MVATVAAARLDAEAVMAWTTMQRLLSKHYMM